MITGVILARNEERNIVECLQHLQPHVEEILLIDMESSDRTVELARPFVRTVLTHPLVPNFDAARNLAIAEARNDWLWYVDADERIPEETGRLVRDVINRQGAEVEALNIPFKSYFCGQWMQHCGWWPGYTMPRVLKKGYFRFSERLHGGVDVDGRQLQLSPDPQLGIEHYSYESVEHYLEKLNRYTSTEAAQMAEEGRQWDWRSAMAHMVQDLWTYYEVNPGGLDEEKGWILSWLSGQYRWLSHAKLIDLKPPAKLEGDTPNIPASLDDVLLFMEEELASLRARRPVVPFGIVWKSPIWDYSGYADEGRAFAKALAYGDRNLVVEDIRWNDKLCQLPERDVALYRALSGRRRPAFSATITDCIPTLVRPDRGASVNIIRTTFETDRIPLEWIGHIDQYQECWVISKHNELAFRRSGVPPERIRVVPSCVDTELFHPDGPKRALPEALDDRFVFLSVFEWQLRKGWDVLLRAYVEEFSLDDSVGLLLKASRMHGQTEESIKQDVQKLLRKCKTSLTKRPDIVFLNETLGAEEMAALYRSAQAFVLPTRGEGWGRPFMEAMACKTPVIGTGASGNVDFMNEKNSFLIPAKQVPVPEAAAREVPTYAGHRWYEPDKNELRRLMRSVVADAALRKRTATRACKEVHERFDLESGRQSVETALLDIESRLVRHEASPIEDSQIRVQIEGEVFASHSFSNINEVMALGFDAKEDLAVSIDRKQYNPTFDERSRVAHLVNPLIGRNFDTGPDVVIRHSFPPNWAPLETGKWIHIQPWEFGHLPKEWIEPLKNDVDEIWAPTNYVKQVYARSGIPEDKVFVIPWGIDPEVFNASVPKLLVPVRKSFLYLFVGGVIERKGFDTLLEAYVSEFGPKDDVCLVVKDLGSRTFYRGSPLRDQLFDARDDKTKPAFLYIDGDLTPGQLSSLYAACDCLVAPYRGEGFGLPILESMACGSVPIVPKGGASDDFVSGRTAFMLPAKEVETVHDWPLCGPPLHLSIEVKDLRKAMRKAFEDRAATIRKSKAAAKYVAGHFTWQAALNQMVERIHVIADTSSRAAHRPTQSDAAGRSLRPTVAACLTIKNAERKLASCLARLAGFVDEIIVFDRQSTDRSTKIAEEYGAKVMEAPKSTNRDRQQAAAVSDWVFWLNVDDRLSEQDSQQIRSLVETQPNAVSELSVQLTDSQLSGVKRKTAKLQLTRTR